MRYARRLMELVGRQKTRFLAGIASAFLMQLSFMFSFGAMYWIFRHRTSLDRTVILQAVGILVAGLCVHLVFRYLQSIWVSAEGYAMCRSLRKRAGERLKGAPLGYFTDTRLGHLHDALTQSMGMIENYTMMLVVDMVSGFGIALLLVIGFFSMHAAFGMLALVLILLAALILARLWRVAALHVPEVKKAEESMTGAVLDMIRGIGVIRTFPGSMGQNMQATIRDQAFSRYAEKRDVDDATERAFSGWSKLYGFVLGAGSVALVLMAFGFAKSGRIEEADALTVIAGSFVIFLGLSPLVNTSFLYVKVPATQAYIDRVLDIPQIPEGSMAQTPSDHRIAFQDVTFSYDGKTPVLRSICAEVREGDHIAIVGPSGSGKTTLLNLLSRFWDVDRGSITIGGIDIRSLTTEALYASLSMVFQDVYLFRDTILQNIRYGRPEASDEACIQAAKDAGCHDFIMEKPQGYSTVLGEGGESLSGGERQRLSIARALVKDAPIILLDEATSSVDPENERLILDAIERLCRGKTVLSIAHRLSTVRTADAIWVMDEGAIVEKGTHAELSGRDGKYKDFILARERAEGWTLLRN